MATNDFSAIQAAFQTRFEPMVQNQINRAIVLLQLLGVKPADSKNITWDVRVGTATPSTAPINDGADVAVFNNDTKIPATLNYGTYHDAFGISGKALAAAAASQQPQQLVDLFADELNDSSERLARALAADVYLGDGSTNRIHGLVDATVPAIGDTGTYATLARGTYAQWKGNVIDALGASISFNLMRELRRKIYEASGEKPDLYICDAVQHEKYGQLFGQQRRYLDQVRAAGGQMIRLDGGYMVLEFDGVPVIEDVQCPAATMIALSTRHVVPRQLMPAAQPGVTGYTGMIRLGGTPEEQFGAGRTNMAAFILPLAKTGDMHKFALYVYPQMQVKRPNACGYLTTLNTSVS
jgi:hypothetical protein